MNRGQTITLLQIFVGGFLAIAGSIGAAWVTANSTVEDKVAGIDKSIGIVEERENNHYAEVQRQLIELNGKIDLILLKSGVVYKGANKESIP